MAEAPEDPIVRRDISAPPPLPPTTEATVPRIERFARRERIDPTTDTLPGNLGWTSSFRDAARGRWERMKFTASSLGDRGGSSVASITEALNRAQQQTKERRSDRYMAAHMRHESSLARIEAQSGIWDLPVASWIKNSRVMYHSWRSHVNERHEAEAEARAKSYERMATSTGKYVGAFDGRIAARGERATSKWRVKLDAAQGKLAEIDSQIEQLSRIVSAQEARIAVNRTEMESLLGRGGGDRDARKARFRTLSRLVTEDEALLRERQKTLDGKYRHQRRLSRAGDRAENEIRFFEDRYLPKPVAEDAVPVAPVAAVPPTVPAEPAASVTAEAAPVRAEAVSPTGPVSEGAPAEAPAAVGRTEAPPAPAPESDRFREVSDRLEGVTTLRQLAELFGNITNRQAGNLWNATFPGAPLPEGHFTLVAMLQEAEPGSTGIADSPDADGSIKDLFAELEGLHGKSERFRALVQQATGKEGESAIQALVTTLSAKIVLTPNLNAL